MAKIMVEEIPSVDINTLIDEAIAKKDRSVTIFISSVGTTIRVDPLGEPLSWIDVSINAEKYGSYLFECPECGRVNEKTSPYCPECGEKLKRPVKEEKND